MTYVDGFVVPVPKKNVDAYRKLSRKMGKIWMEHGALSYKECVLEDETDSGFCLTFAKGIKPKKGETVFFSFITYKSRKQRDAVNKKVMADPRVSCGAEQKMPFDCTRMMYGGFKALVDL